MSDHTKPYIDANPILRRFRQDGNFSWKQFNELWRLICDYVNSPSNDILMQTTPTDQGKYDAIIQEMVDDAIEIGIFGSHTRGILRPDTVEGQAK